jgi:hypothetical protein
MTRRARASGAGRAGTAGHRRDQIEMPRPPLHQNRQSGKARRFCNFMVIYFARSTEDRKKASSTILKNSLLFSLFSGKPRRTVEDAETMRLACEDQIRFAEALINPPVPGARGKRAAKRSAELVEEP